MLYFINRIHKYKQQNFQEQVRSKEETGMLEFSIQSFYQAKSEKTNSIENITLILTTAVFVVFSSINGITKIGKKMYPRNRIV